MEELSPMEKRLKGYKTIIIIQWVLLIVMAICIFSLARTKRESELILTEQRDTLVSRLSVMMDDFDGLQSENDTINAHLEVERLRADSLMDRLRQERNWNAAKIRQYEGELGSLRLIMQGYVRQIDSLNTLAQSLQRENVEYRRQASTLQLRAETAEERAEELDIKVRQGAMILARDIQLLALNNNDREVTRASRAARLRTDLVLTANELAEPGSRDIYVRIIAPDGYVLANASNETIEVDGERITYSASRQVDYQNQDLAVNVFYNGGGIVAGKYAVSIYMDGRLIGSNEILLK
jgi:hypothetical protein